MKPALFLLLLMIATMVGQPALAGDVIGVRKIAVASPQRGKALAVTIWYPARKGGKETLIGDNKLFKGTPAFGDAPVAPGHHPLILISHGSGARIENLGWLAAGLVEAGFIVAGPNHPGTTSGDSTPIDTPKLWERTQDLSIILTALTSDPQWKGLIAEEKIGVLGFSLGGAAAMEISGARADLEAYARYCDTYRAMADCMWFAGGKGYVEGKAVATEKVDLRKIDKNRFEQSNLDPRIRAAVLVDPSLAQAYVAESLKQIAIPLHFINLGRPRTIPVAVIADKLAKLVPNSTYTQVDDAVHFSFLAECQAGGAEFLKSLGDADRLCDDGGVRSRADIHTQLRAMIAEAFTKSLDTAM
ncbi:alpha/beta hydrolase family protein [Taklimakanibacter deserti]|uniref:alpha/beta hydrolase family protein n=1 Tax=Taklimakanibacter deserti TaxID=2267839 RepID=UPI000E647CEC